MQNQMIYTVKNYIEDFPHIVYSKGVTEGRAEARTEGILALIYSLSEFQIPTTQIREQLISKFGLVPEEADEYLGSKPL